MFFLNKNHLLIELCSMYDFLFDCLNLNLFLKGVDMFREGSVSQTGLDHALHFAEINYSLFF